MANIDNFSWDSHSFFERLTSTNRLAVDGGYQFCRVSSLEGFQEALTNMMDAEAIVGSCDLSQGTLITANSPHVRRVKTVFLAKRHAFDSMDARMEAMNELRELFRQFMTKLILEKTMLEEQCIYMDDRISFTEIEKYFFSGCACAFFQIAIDTYANLAYDPDEWLS